MLERGYSVHPGELDVHENKTRIFLGSELESFLGRLALYGLVTLNLEHSLSSMMRISSPPI